MKGEFSTLRYGIFGKGNAPGQDAGGTKVMASESLVLGFLSPAKVTALRSTIAGVFPFVTCAAPGSFFD